MQILDFLHESAWALGFLLIFAKNFQQSAKQTKKVPEIGNRQSANQQSVIGPNPPLVNLVTWCLDSAHSIRRHKRVEIWLMFKLTRIAKLIAVLIAYCYAWHELNKKNNI